VTTNNKKRKSEPQVEATQLASDAELRAAPAKKTKTTSDSNVPEKRSAPRPRLKTSTSSKNAKVPLDRTAKELVPLDRAANKAGTPSSFVTPVHPSTKATGKRVTQQTVPESRASSLRRTGIFILG
jgi:hypothetical protein